MASLNCNSLFDATRRGIYVRQHFHTISEQLLYIIAAIICFFGLFGLFDVASGEQSKGYVYIMLAVAIAGFTWADRNESRQVRRLAWTITIAALGLWAYFEYL